MTDYIYVIHPLSQNRFAAEVRQPDGSQWSKDNKWWLGRDYATAADAENAVTEHLNERRAFLSANPPYVYPRVMHAPGVVARLRDEYGDRIAVSATLVYEYDPSDHAARTVRYLADHLTDYPGDCVIEPPASETVKALLKMRIGGLYKQANGFAAGPAIENTGPDRLEYPFAIMGGYSDYRFYTADGRGKPYEDRGLDLVEEVGPDYGRYNIERSA